MYAAGADRVDFFQSSEMFLTSRLHYDNMQII